MTNSVVIFNSYLHLRGISRFTLLNSSGSLKSPTIFNNMVIFFLLKLFYFNVFNSALTKLKNNITSYLSLVTFIIFFTLFQPGTIIPKSNYVYNLKSSFNLFFFKFGTLKHTFFTEILAFFSNVINFSGFFSLFNKRYGLNVPVFNQELFYSYIGFFTKLKDFYKFSLININLSYIYLKIPYTKIVSVSNLFKKNLLLTLHGLYDIFTVDYPSRLLRFELVYGFTSIYSGVRVFLKTHVSENLSVLSISAVFNSANWLERECWDLFGVFFANHKNLRRILTDYGFRGFPFRKDFPLTGYIEVRFDDSLFSIVYEPLEISQEFRVFNFKSPWENYEV